MKSFVVKLSPPLEGSIRLPGDKSIAHRAVILSSLSAGTARISNFPFNRDCLQTIRAFRSLGAAISCNEKKGTVLVRGRGKAGLRPAQGNIFTGESGTTMRLLLGVLAGQPFASTLSASASLSRRPMLRVTAPLRGMGARITARRKKNGAALEEYPPVAILPGSLKGISYSPPVASAQVKSALLLAGLFATGRTRVIEPMKTRDHTERMLRSFGVKVSVRGNEVSIKGPAVLKSPGKVTVPGDISSAAFFIVAALLAKGSRVLLKDVSLNPSRMGAVRVLKRMGARIWFQARTNAKAGAEPAGWLKAQSSALKGVRVRAKEIPWLIDELPVLMVAAACARGSSVFEGVGELRVKETDRIRSMSENLRKMGVDIRASRSKGREDIVIKGTKLLHGARVRSFGDHRTAMSMIIAGMNASGMTAIDDIDCIKKSFPGFLQKLKGLSGL